MADLIPSVSIDAILQRREAMIERLTRAHALLSEIADLSGAFFGAPGNYRLTVYTHERNEFTSARGVEDLTKEIDSRAWAYLLERSGLQSFLDAAAREKWRAAIGKNDVPPLTRENIEATFKTLYAGRREMFERGVIDVFRSLSWDYKTNSPRMFGKRLILTHAVETWTHRKSETFGIHHRGADRLDDLTRVLSVLDGKPEPDYRNSTYRRCNDARWMRDGGPSVATFDYFTIKGFKNGNAHLAFTRPDLVDEMNKILAKHHPGALPPAEEVTHA